MNRNSRGGRRQVCGVYSLALLAVEKLWLLQAIFKPARTLRHINRGLYRLRKNSQLEGHGFTRAIIATAKDGFDKKTGDGKKTGDRQDDYLHIHSSSVPVLSVTCFLESVVPDYFGSFPKACVGGWGRQTMLIDPIGQALPCHSAAVIPNLVFENVRHHDLAWIWQESRAFQRFRGDAWMSPTCLACPRKEQDFGGCRCQAFLLTGDAEAIDPVCIYSPHHSLLQTLREQTPELLPIWRG
jgi:radical SAM protein with 4Fe4S-binding SPASM domain